MPEPLTLTVIAAAVLATCAATIGYTLFALRGLGGKRLVIALVDYRHHLLTVSVAALAVALAEAEGEELRWLAGAAAAGCAVLWIGFLLNVPERRYRAIVDPPIRAASEVDIPGLTRVLAFDLPDGPTAIVVNVAAWHHIFELPSGDRWFTGTY